MSLICLQVTKDKKGKQETLLNSIQQPKEILSCFQVALREQTLVQMNSANTKHSTMLTLNQHIQTRGLDLQTTVNSIL